MRILVVCQYYYPEPFRLPDICEEMVRRGHEVAVVTGVPNYPMGEIYEGYRHGERRDETINGVKVHRCYTIGRRHGALYRLLNYYSFALSSTVYLKRLREEYDAVFVNQQSPVMMANGAIAYSRKHKKKLVLYCMDLWPESLVTGGIRKGSLIYRFFHRESARVYKNADVLLGTSRSFSDYFAEEFGISGVKYLPQYAETIFRPEDCRKEPNEYLDLMFAGNVGAAQSVDTILEAARLTAPEKHIRWHIVGDGSESERLRKMAQGMENVIFHGRKPLEEMPQYYAMADAMVVTMQRDPVISLTLPGKVQTYMAAGKPVLGAIDGETRRVIQEADCGLCGPAEDPQLLAKNARELWQRQEEYGRNALIYYETHFAKNGFMEALLEYMK